MNAKTGECRVKIFADDKGVYHVQLEEKQYDERGHAERGWGSYGTSSITDSIDKAEELAMEELKMHTGEDDLPTSVTS